MLTLKNFNKQIPLWTYSEIVASATSEWYPRTDTIAELNTRPLDYINSLSSWWHIAWAQSDYPYIIWIKHKVSKMFYAYIAYDTISSTNWWEHINEW